MKKYLIRIIFFLFVISESQAQSVGLVLSGGGAKGIAHIGIIKALEENEIPIDYIAGTSIGAIIGSLYATGYSPDEMIDLIKSDNFIAWQTGKVDKKDLYYFKKNDPTPEFGRFNIDLGDSSKTKNGYAPMSLVNPIQINLGMIELYAQSSAAVNYDFDKLIVPFRCVASDTYNKQQIIFRKGDLSIAVRASMSLPFVFRAIEINNTPVYDGGIYNNFPVDVMLADFNPDYIIGSVVVQKHNAVKKNLFGQIENMVMQKTDYSIDENRGIVIQSIMSDIGLLEFDKVDKIYEIGYKTGLTYVKQIRQQVHRQVKPESIELKRMAFKCHKPDLVFKNIEITGVSKTQKEYILSQIKRDEKGLISFDAFKKTYYRLLSDRKIAEIHPEAVYNIMNQNFDLILNVRINENVTIGIGGFISSATPNLAYLGLQYQTLRFYSLDFNASAQLGNSYNAVLLSGRIEIPSVLPLFLKFSVASSTKKFFESKRLFSDENISAYLRQSETFARASLGTPFKTMGKAVASFTTGKLTDEYTQNITAGSTMNLEKSTYYLSGLSLRLEKNTLNSVVYPSSGIHACFLVQGFSGKEPYNRDETSNSTLRTYDNHTWGQAELKVHQYTQLLHHISLGTQLDVIMSSKPLFNNYEATLVQSPAFAPTPHSKLVFNESLRALSYAAAGLMPVWENSKGFQIRGEVYGFLPYQHITADSENKAVLGQSFGKPAYMGELSLVYNFPIVSVSIYGNHYSFPENNWNWGINIGLLLYNPKFIE